MKWIIKSLAIIVLGIVQTVYPAGHQSHSDSSFVRFMTGVLLLQGTTAISDEMKSIKYNELIKITGINADTAIQYLSGLRQNLLESKMLYEEIKKEYSINKSLQSIQSNEKVKE